jgi:hypothetical protein
MRELPVTPRTIPRLPLAPLLPYLVTEARWLDERNHRRHPKANSPAGPPAALESLIGCTRRTAQRIVSAGQIREDDADRIAAALGYHPADIWGGAWWALNPEDAEAPS